MNIAATGKALSALGIARGEALLACIHRNVQP